MEIKAGFKVQMHLFSDILVKFIDVAIMDVYVCVFSLLKDNNTNNDLNVFTDVGKHFFRGMGKIPLPLI